MGTAHENGEIFKDYCASNDVVIEGSLFEHKPIHKITWTSPDKKTTNQIDYIAVKKDGGASFLV